MGGLFHIIASFFLGERRREGERERGADQEGGWIGEMEGAEG